MLQIIEQLVVFNVRSYRAVEVVMLKSYGAAEVFNVTNY